MRTPVLALFILTVVPLLVSCNYNSYYELPGIIATEVEVLKTTHKVPHNLTKAVRNVSKIRDRKIADEVFCQTCDLVFYNIITYRKAGASKDSMMTFLKKLCTTFSDWGPVACSGYINIEIDTILYIIDNKKDLTPYRICSIYYQAKNCGDPNAKKWTVAIPPKRKQHAQHYYVDAVPLKILHLTDFHFDPEYQAGSNAVCELPLCCQKSNGPPSKPGNGAGFWGDYHVCDMPWYTVTNFTSYLLDKKEKYDLVYYTGDIISHKSWATNKTSNIAAIKQLFQHFKTVFKGTPVYPVLGNHEPHPTDFYSPGNVTTPSISTQWVFDLVANEWNQWLKNDTNANSTIRRGGFYTILVKPGFRIVALNSNVCFTSNIWLIYDDADPYGQLVWLVDVLTKAEKNGEKVHILSHIPPGELQCVQRWTNQFRNITNRFAPIISAQFNGHTHLDEIRFFPDTKNPKKVVNVAFNAGSFTTFVGFNPNYRTYDVDPNTYRVINYDHYIFNLTEANSNKTRSPRWYKLYSFKDAYGLKNTTNEGFADLVERMSKNHTLVQTYFRFQGRDSPPSLAIKCDDTCLKRTLCGITAVEASQSIHCQYLQKKQVAKHSDTA